MSEDEKGSEKPVPSGAGGGGKAGTGKAGTGKADARAERQARLAAALRQNLRRRKAPAGPAGAGGRSPPDSSQD